MKQFTNENNILIICLQTILISLLKFHNNNLLLTRSYLVYGERIWRNTEKKISVAGIDEIPPEVRKKRTFEDTLLRFYRAVYKPGHERKINQSLSLGKKGVLRVTKNYRGISWNR